MADFRGVVKDLVWQFAYRGNDHSGKWLSTGGLSALEGAFKALGWNDPYYVEGGGCEHPGCKAWATCGTPIRPAISAFAVSIFGGALPALDAV